jgi:hypothetical protein
LLSEKENFPFEFDEKNKEVRNNCSCGMWISTTVVAYEYTLSLHLAYLLLNLLNQRETLQNERETLLSEMENC